MRFLRTTLASCAAAAAAGCAVVPTGPVVAVPPRHVHVHPVPVPAYPPAVVVPGPVIVPARPWWGPPRFAHPGHRPHWHGGPRWGHGHGHGHGHRHGHGHGRPGWRGHH